MNARGCPAPAPQISQQLLTLRQLLPTADVAAVVTAYPQVLCMAREELDAALNRVREAFPDASQVGALSGVLLHGADLEGSRRGNAEQAFSRLATGGSLPARDAASWARRADGHTEPAGGGACAASRQGKPAGNPLPTQLPSRVARRRPSRGAQDELDAMLSANAALLDGGAALERCLRGVGHLMSRAQIMRCLQRDPSFLYQVSAP